MAQQARLKRRTVARKARPPALDAIGSAYAVKVGVLLDPVLALFKKKVLPLAEPDETPKPGRQDAADFETIVKEFGPLRLAIFKRMLAGVELEAWRATKRINVQNKNEFQRLLAVDPFKDEPWLRPLSSDWVQENISRVRTVAEKSLGQLEATILRMVRGGESIKAIRGELEAVFGLTKREAKRLARDQVNKFNGQLTQERQTRVGVTEYVWHTAEDQRVRPDHGRLDGETFKWKKPPVTVSSGKRAGERNHPGGDIQCRCWAEPVLGRLLA